MIRNSLPAVLLVFVWMGSLSFAQQTSTSTGTSIRGTVIDGRTSRPLNGATVALHKLPARDAGSSVSTGADGSFVFQSVVPGQYRLTASHNGYLDSSEGSGRSRANLAAGSNVSVTAGGDVDGVVLRLTPTGVIAGRITNEREEPMPGVSVETLKSFYRDGRREFSDARTGFTDDRGEFRVWGLAPGRYYIKVTSPRFGQGAAAPIYVPAFYPGVIDPRQAQPVQLHSGEELDQINLVLNPSSTVHVRGRVLTSNGAPAKMAQVTLSQFGGSGYVVEAQTDSTGKFDAASVPPGSYSMVAQWSESFESERMLVGRAMVSVSEASIDAPDIVVYPGATLSGHVQVAGDRKAVPRMNVLVRPLGGGDTATYSGSEPLQPDGSFSFRDVPEGSYLVQLSSLPEGYYVKTAGEGADAGVVVSHGHAPPVEFRIGPGAAQIQGTVYKDKDNQEVAASAMVVLAPDASRRSNSEYFRAATADQSGKFSLRSVPPGEYSLFAWTRTEPGAYMDPDFLRQYEDSAKPVRVEEGDKLSLQVQVMNVPDDSQ